MASSGAPVAARKHVELSLELKRKLIQEHEHGVPFALLGKKYHIATSTAANIWRKKEFFLRSRMSGSRKRCNDRSKYKLVNQVTAIFVRNMLQTDHKIDGEVIKRFARTAASQCNFGDFHGSNGWLDSFKKRENVRWVKRRNQKETNAQPDPSVEPDSLDNNSILGARCVRMGDVIRSKLGLRCDIARFNREDDREGHSSAAVMDRDSIIDEWFLGIPLLCRIFQEKQDRKSSQDQLLEATDQQVPYKGGTMSSAADLFDHQQQMNVDQMEEFCQTIDKEDDELIMLATKQLEQTGPSSQHKGLLSFDGKDYGVKDNLCLSTGAFGADNGSNSGCCSGSDFNDSELIQQQQQEQQFGARLQVVCKRDPNDEDDSVYQTTISSGYHHQQDDGQYDSVAVGHLDIDFIHDGCAANGNIENFSHLLFSANDINNNTTTDNNNDSNNNNHTNTNNNDHYHDNNNNSSGNNIHSDHNSNHSNMCDNLCNNRSGCFCDETDDVDNDDHLNHPYDHCDENQLDRYTVIRSIVTLLRYANKFNPCILDTLMDVKRCVERDLNIDPLSDQFTSYLDNHTKPHHDDRFQYD